MSLGDAKVWVCEYTGGGKGMALLPVPSGQSQRGSVSKLGSSHCLWAAIFDDMLWMRPPGALLCAQTSPQGRKRLRTLRGTSRFSEPWELETLGHPLLLWVRVRVVELRLNKPKACAQSQRAWPGIRDVSPGSDSLGHDGVQRLYSHVGELCLSQGLAAGALPATAGVVCLLW